MLLINFFVLQISNPRIFVSTKDIFVKIFELPLRIYTRKSPAVLTIFVISDLHRCHINDRLRSHILTSVSAVNENGFASKHTLSFTKKEKFRFLIPFRIRRSRSSCFVSVAIQKIVIRSHDIPNPGMQIPSYSFYLGK